MDQNLTIGELLDVNVDDLFNESLTEAKSKNSDQLQSELNEIKDNLNDFGPEGFYGVPLQSFKREFPEFFETVIKTFLKDMVEISEEELNDPEMEEAWKTGDLILPEDWETLIDGAERLLTSRKDKGIQWEKVHKSHYHSFDEDLNEGEDIGGLPISKGALAAARSSISENPYLQQDESLNEDLNVIRLTTEDHAQALRSAIRSCWENVDVYTLTSQQMDEYGNIEAKAALEALVNDFYIAIGALEGCLEHVDPRSSNLDTAEEAKVAVQVVGQPSQAVVLPMVEKFILDERNLLNESDAFDDDIKKTADKPKIETQPKEKDVVEFNRKPIEKELEATEKHRKENVKTSMNPDREELEEELDNMANVDDANYFKDEVDDLQDEAGQLAQEADQAGLSTVKKAAEAAFDALDDPTLNENEDLGNDETLNPRFYESLLKLED